MDAKQKAEQIYWKYVKKIDPNFGILVKRRVHDEAVKLALADEKLKAMKNPNYIAKVKAEIEKI